MNIFNIPLHLGLVHPVKIFYMTDIHLAYADESLGDPPELIPHAGKRTEVFKKEAGYPPKNPEEYFAEGMDLGRSCDLTVITGDVLDFISRANFAAADRVLKGYDYMFTAGNHEFCPRVGVPDSYTRRVEIYGDIQRHFKGNMRFDFRILGGLLVVTFDNSYNYFEGELTEKLTDVLDRYRLPTIVFCHVPLDDAHITREKPDKYLLPDEKMIADTDTMLEILRTRDEVKAVFSGHWHGNRDRTIVNGKPQYTVGGAFKGIAAMIEIE